MSFIVYGVTKTVTDKLAEEASRRVIIDETGKRMTESWEDHKERVYNRRRSLPLSGEFSSPEFAKEYIALIEKSGVKYKNLTIKVKELVVYSPSGKFGARLVDYEEVK